MNATNDIVTLSVEAGRTFAAAHLLDLIVFLCLISIAQLAFLIATVAATRRLPKQK